MRATLFAVTLALALGCDNPEAEARRANARAQACAEHGGALRVVEQPPIGFSSVGALFLICRDGFAIPWSSSLSG